MFPLLQVGLLNVNGFYDFLLSYIEKAVEDGFISPREHHLIISGTTPAELVEKLEVIHCNLRKLLSPHIVPYNKILKSTKHYINLILH